MGGLGQEGRCFRGKEAGEVGLFAVEGFLDAQLFHDLHQGELVGQVQLGQGHADIACGLVGVVVGVGEELGQVGGLDEGIEIAVLGPDDPEAGGPSKGEGEGVEGLALVDGIDPFGVNEGEGLVPVDAVEGLIFGHGLFKDLIPGSLEIEGGGQGEDGLRI